MDILNFLKSFVDPGQAQTLLYLVGANLVAGVLGALIKGEFQVAKLKDFWKTVGTVFVAYTTVAVAAKGLADFAPMVTAVYWALVGLLGAKILNNMKEWGLQLPEKFYNFLGK